MLDFTNPGVKAQIWNSADDVIRDKIRKGELSWSEAGALVIPMGDLEQATMREQYPTRGPATGVYPAQEETAPRGLDSFEPVVITGAGGSGTAEDPLYVPAWSPISEDELYARAPVGATIRGLDGDTTRRSYGATDILGGGALRMGQIGLNAFTAFGDTNPVMIAARKLGVPGFEVERYEQARQQIREASRSVDDMRRAPETTFQDVKDADGVLDTLGTAGQFIAGQGAYSAADMLASMALPIYTAARTQEVAESRAENDGRAREELTDYLAALPAAAVESMLERFTTAKLFTGTGADTLVGKLAQQTALQGSTGGIEEVAAYTGETLGTQRGWNPQEALDTFFAGALAEAGIGASVEVTKAGLNQLRTPEVDPLQTDDFLNLMATIRQENENQRIGKANREKFDAELAAERLVRDTKSFESYNKGDQLEMPIGSGFAGNVGGPNVDGTLAVDADGNPIEGNLPRTTTERDRVPTSVDMFTGESIAAPKLEERRAANEAEAAALAEGRPNLTDAEFERRSEREFRAREGQEVRRQDAFENEKQAQELGRRKLAEAQTTIKSERQLLSTTDITKEAKRLVEVEKEGLRTQRQGIARTPEQMEATLRAYERKRLPELVENVRNRRLAQVNDARDLVIAEENRKLEQPPTPEQEQREATRAADSFNRQPRSFTGQPTAISPGFRVGNQGATLTDLLAERQQGASSRVRSEAVPMNEAPLPAGQVEMALPKATDAQGDLFGGRGFTGEPLTLDQTRIALEEGQRRRRALLTQRAQAVQEEVVDEVVTEEAATTAPSPLVAQARKAQADIEKSRKGAETRKTNKMLKDRIKQGMTPEEAAEDVDRILNPKEDADLRNELEATTEAPATGDLPSNLFEGEGHPNERVRNNNRNTLRSNPKYYLAAKAELESSNPSIARMLQLVIDDPSQSVGYRNLARILIPLMERAEVKLIPAPITDSNAGVYSPSTNTIRLNVLQPETVLHEALHAALTRMINQPQLFPKEMQDRIKKTTRSLEELRLKLINDFSNNRLTNLDGTPSRDMLGHMLANGQGPLSNVDELVSYFMTNPHLQFLAGQVEGTPEFARSLKAWVTSVIQAIGQMLGLTTVTDRSALQQIILSTSQMLKDVAQADVVDGTTLTDLPQVAETLAPTPSTKVFTGAGFLRPEWKTNLGQAVMDAFTAGGGSVSMKGRSAISEIFERSSGETGALIARAEGLFRQMDSGLSALAYNSKRDPDHVRNEFASDVAKFENAPERATKATTATSLKEKYGPVATAYFAARETIDNMSLEILQQRLSDPRPFTQEEAEIYRSIKENMGKYYTRVYAANTRGIGEKRAKKLWKEFSKVLKGSTKEAYKDGYKLIVDAINYVASHNLVIPDNVDELPIAKLQELAKAWGLTIRGTADFEQVPDLEERREALIAALEQQGKVSPQARVNRAQQLVEGLLFAHENSPLVSYYRQTETDRTIVSDRKVVPEEIRKLLGEYEDTPLKAMTTIIRMAAFRSRTKAFNELLQSQLGQTIVSEEEFQARNLSEREWIKITEDGYGPLKNMYIRKDIASNVRSTVEMTRTFDQILDSGERGVADAVVHTSGWATEKWMQFAGAVKGMQLVWNVSNAMWNYVGGGLVSLSNGHILDVGSIKRAHAIASKLVAAQVRGVTDSDMEKVIRAGITDSALLGSIRKVEAEKLDDILFANLRTPAERTGRRVITGLSDRGRVWRETYAMADVVWKIANFLAEEKKLAAMYKAANVDMTPEAIEREAAWRTNLSNFSYKRVPNIIKMIEKGGLTYVMPYIYETFRALGGSLVVGVTDIARSNSLPTPEAKALAIKNGVARITGTLMALGAAQQAAYFALDAMNEALGGEEDEDEWVEKLKALLPDYKKFAHFTYLGRNAEGEPVLLETTRADPFGPVTEFTRMAMQGADASEYMDAIKNLLIVNPYGSGVVQAFLGQGTTNTRLQDATPGVYSFLVDLFDSDTLGTDGEYIVRAIDRVLPSAFTRLIDPNNAPTSGEGINDALSLALKVIGTELHNVDPVRRVQFATMDFRQQRGEALDKRDKALKLGHNMSDNDLAGQMAEAFSLERRAFDDMQDLYNGMQQVGYTREQILKSMKEVGNISDSDLYMIAAGYTPANSSLLNPESIERSYTKMVQRGDAKARTDKYLQNIQQLARLIREGKLYEEK